MVARVFGSVRAPVRSSTSALGSSEPAGQDAARPVVFERAADQPDAVGEQRRSERVAGKARVAPAVERELERPGAVDEAARGKAPDSRQPSPDVAASLRLRSLIDAARARVPAEVIVGVTSSPLMMAPWRNAPGYRVGRGVPRHDKPVAAAGAVVPKLLVRPGGVVAQVRHSRRTASDAGSGGASGRGHPAGAAWHRRR